MSQTKPELISVAVCGAHMSGLPLNSQLLALGGQFVEKTKTGPYYKLFKLNGFMPERPGLLRVAEQGSAICLEVWKLPIKNYGAFVASVPAPLGFGTLVLKDGSQVQGFLCEAYATLDAIDISGYGGWRNYLKETTSQVEA
ncbi:MAG: allophanate hydrolase-related protein [Methylophilaceae bacterium]